MKKIFIITLIALVSLFSLFADKTYEIETKYGLKTVVVPDGYTAEDVLLIIAKNYYELDHEYKDLQETVKELTESANQYIEANHKLREDYEALKSDYEILTEKLTKLSKTTTLYCFSFANILFDFQSVISGASIDFGLVIKETFMIKTGISYNLSNKLGLSLGLGYMF